MIDINELRTRVKEATPGPWEVSEDNRYPGVYAGEEAVFGGSFCDYLEPSDKDQAFIAAANPAVITELLGRLEAAESEAIEQARLNGMGASREAALMAKLEAAEKERDALRAKIEAMERQKSVGIVHRYGRALNGSAWLGVAWNPEADEFPTGTALYTLPGAKGEEK